MKERIVEFLASIIASAGFGLTLIAVFCIFWGIISLCVWLVLALFDITRNIMTAAIIGLAFALLYVVMQR
nr:MAG TPA: hypothetical protein [Caudoviricetes sp.]